MRKELIESYIDSLRASLGPVRQPIAEDSLRFLHNKKDYAGMVGHVKSSLRLDTGIRLGLVKKGGPDAPAWVVKPTNMPLFGTASFRQLVITVYLRKSFLETGCFEEVVCATAHELCHIVLDAIKHPLRRQEEAVDLTAMLLGFRDFYITGCRSVRDVSSQEDVCAGHRIIRTRTQGYLTYEEVGHAATYMTFR
ncbi:MAG: hypothetical protein PHD04_03140 [Candidatus Pacebacteria bacterium]|nr:hypothetical protein [Candidatus Paceibacterota bacterium]